MDPLAPNFSVLGLSDNFSAPPSVNVTKTVKKKKAKEASVAKKGPTAEKKKISGEKESKPASTETTGKRLKKRTKEDKFNSILDKLLAAPPTEEHSRGEEEEKEEEAGETKIEEEAQRADIAPAAAAKDVGSPQEATPVEKVVSKISRRTETKENLNASSAASMKKIFNQDSSASKTAEKGGEEQEEGEEEAALSKKLPIHPAPSRSKVTIGYGNESDPEYVNPLAPPGTITQLSTDYGAMDRHTTPTTDPLEKLLHKKIYRAVTEKHKIERLTRVQQLAWEPMMEPDRDVLVRSETGSGKTLAYALPLLNRLITDCDTKPINRESGTMIVVLCPTRELTEQVANVAQLLCNFAQFVTTGSIHGGDNRHKEKARLRKGIHVLVATPGRFLDHLKTTSSFGTTGLQTLVLDEADRLLDMGFERAIREIVTLVSPKKRVLVSATITRDVERLSHFALENPITVGETEDVFAVPASLRQHFTLCNAKHRLTTLIAFLRTQLDAGAKKIAVFMSTSDSTEFHYLLLSRLMSPFTSKKRQRPGFGKGSGMNRFAGGSNKKLTQMANEHLLEGGAAANIPQYEDEDEDDDEAMNSQLYDKDPMLSVDLFKLHGNMNQVDRAAVFHNFSKKCDKGVLFCTDVAARGLDMPHIDWIVHYDPPTDERCYVHRVGRTARIGKVGDSMLFLMPHEGGYAEYLASFTGIPMSEKKPEVFMFYLTKLDPSSNHLWVQSAATLQRGICQTVRQDDTLGRVALFGYQSFIRAYAGFPRAVRQFFNKDDLHLGHIANTFGLDQKPSDVRKRLRMDNVVKDERTLARDTKRFRKGEKLDSVMLHDERQTENAYMYYKDESQNVGGGAGRPGEYGGPREQYHSTIVTKGVKKTKDWYESKRDERRATPKPFQFSEFDA